MKTITIKNEPVQIPTSWNDITVGNAVKLSELVASNPDIETICIIAAYSI